MAGLVRQGPVSGQQRADERCCSVRRSRVVLTPRRWRQVRGVESAQPGLDKTYPLATVAKEPDRRGARRKPLKPLRAGTSGDSGVLVVTRVRSTTTKCTRGRGCQGHPAFPTPSLGVRFINGSGAWRRGTKTRVEVEARTSQPVVPANAGIHNHRTSLLCRGVSAVFQFQRHGVWVPAFAGTTAGLAFMHTPIPLPPLILPARCRY